ncbi:MAG: transporter substrate-binding domain-containing protein [Treponema sp.]|jgi:L-cystine transport system substrate-binding protein|nr:transporter substrate-binding domain-containing protein [Treponema sp.]
MKKKDQRFFSAALVLPAVVLVLALGGCGAKKADTAEGPAPLKVPVAVANDFIPYAYLDEQGNYIGYEVELLQAIDELLPEYEFEYVTESDQWIALTSGKVDIITHQWESNPKRLETYLFGKEMITTWASHLGFKPGRTDLNTVQDMEGKTIQVGQGSGAAYFVETYNATHGNKINIVYSSGGTEVTLSKLDTGAIDAYLGALRNLEITEKNYNTVLGKSREPIYNVYTYLVFRKNDPTAVPIQEATDRALKILRKNGKMKELSEKWLGGDFSQWGEDHVED